MRKREELDVERGVREGDGTYDEETLASSGGVLSCDDVRVCEIADVDVGLFTCRFNRSGTGWNAYWADC